MLLPGEPQKVEVTMHVRVFFIAVVLLMLEGISTLHGIESEIKAQTVIMEECR